MNKDLIQFLYSYNAIQKGDFVGKSGFHYSIETDVRNAFMTAEVSMYTSKLILELLSKHGVPKLPFIGVPETGTLLAFVLNQNQDLPSDYSINMLRSSEKNYQSSTNTVHTVLPIDERQEYILIEDDVVTGKTLIKYLEIALSAGLKIKYVVSIFGRDTASAVKNCCALKGINYIELINTKELERKILWDTGAKK